MKPSIAIIGASNNRSKFGNKAVRAYAQRGYQVFPIHPSAERIEGLPAFRSIRDVPVDELDRVSFYLPPSVGLAVIEQLAQKKIGEVWLNPGAESDELIARSKALGLNLVVGCSIVDINVNPHELPE